MNIGIVLDGVLTNLEQFQFDYGSKFYFEKEMELKNPRGYTVQEIFHKHGNYLKDYRVQKGFWDVYYEFYLLKEQPRPFAAEVIERLKRKGFGIYLFCTRTYQHFSLDEANIKQMTQLWLVEHGIYFDFLIFSDIINVELMKKYEIDLFLDHDPKTIFSLSFHLPVVCFHAKYNELCRGENIYRVFSWYDFYEKLDLISKTEYLEQR